ncbi:MAG: aminopeptidase P family protein [Clostridiales bacterium]|nr:aminopeptidase P family protein [Candidatus Blautia equi]
MIQERLARLRSIMKERSIDAYLVPTDDFHCSEYVGDYFKCRKYITGFTGSAGTAVILMEEAGLWTDGRYFLQAGMQLKGTGVELYKMAEPGVPTVNEFLKEKLSEGMTLAYDGRVMAAKKAEDIKAIMAKKNVKVETEMDLIGEIWEDRPALSAEPAFELSEEWSGKLRVDKIAEIREAMKTAGCDGFLLSALEDINWLLNIRGNDIHCCPVVLSYLYMTQEKLVLFVNETVFSEEIKNNLTEDGIELMPYNAVYEYVKELPQGITVLVDKNKLNDALLSAIPGGVSVKDGMNLTQMPKAIKNSVEIQHERDAHIKDGVAVTKFIYWMKKNVGKTEITELSAAEKLLEFRKAQKGFLEESFDPIIAYGPHAAIIHYSPTEESDVPFQAKGMVLCDTGGHYLEGSTDITRTVVLGPVTEEEKEYFTRVLRGNLNLGAVKFRHGCTGINLDILAKAPLWEIGEDYNHGTGHGVGYILSVHEGPNSVRWKHLPGHGPVTVFEEGMLTSNEPGYYKAGAFGIRHENMMVCQKEEATEYGQYMSFETLTMVPFDIEGIEPSLLNTREKKVLNAYHEQVYETISPYLEEEEKAWLAEVTAAI